MIVFQMSILLNNCEIENALAPLESDFRIHSETLMSTESLAHSGKSLDFTESLAHSEKSLDFTESLAHSEKSLDFTESLAHSEKSLDFTESLINPEEGESSTSDTTIPTKFDILNSQRLETYKNEICNMLMNELYFEQIGDQLTELYNSINNENMEDVMNKAREIYTVAQEPQRQEKIQRVKQKHLKNAEEKIRRMICDDTYKDYRTELNNLLGSIDEDNIEKTQNIAYTYRDICHKINKEKSNQLFNYYSGGLFTSFVGFCTFGIGCLIRNQRPGFHLLEKLGFFGMISGPLILAIGFYFV
jgi:hypothetical protein